MEKLLIAVVAIASETLMETGKQVGTASNQVLLGILVVALILVVLYRERQQNRGNKLAEARHEQLVGTIEKERTAWDEERRLRISALMELVKDNTKAIEHSASAEIAVKDAVEANTRMTERLIDKLAK